MSTREPTHPDHKPTLLTRRQWVQRVGGFGAVTGVAGYLALAPEDAPFSLADETGLRSIPVEPVFTLPDFRVAKRMGAGEVGIGRGGAVRGRMLKALDAVGGLSHFVQPGDVVLVKPNVAFDRSPNLGATTNPELIETLIKLLLVDARAAEVRVCDNPIESPADCFAKSGIRAATLRGGVRRACFPSASDTSDTGGEMTARIADWNDSANAASLLLPGQRSSPSASRRNTSSCWCRR